MQTYLIRTYPCLHMYKGIRAHSKSDARFAMGSHWQTLLTGPSSVTASFVPLRHTAPASMLFGPVPCSCWGLLFYRGLTSATSMVHSLKRSTPTSYDCCCKDDDTLEKDAESTLNPKPWVFPCLLRLLVLLSLLSLLLYYYGYFNGYCYYCYNYYCCSSGVCCRGPGLLPEDVIPGFVCGLHQDQFRV